MADNHSKRLFHIGPQKGATTWVYECLKTHPDIITSATDSVHYYDMHYHKGRSWYDDQFAYNSNANGSCYFDPTYTYSRSPAVATRISKDFIDPKFILNLRHPVDRAFSHYWHERKKGKINYNFDAVLTNYDLFNNWIKPGLYAELLRPYIDHFGVESILPIKVSDIKSNPEQCLQLIYRHAQISADHAPPTATEMINSAGARQTILRRGLFKIGNIITQGHAGDSLFWRKMGGIENQDDIISKVLHTELMQIFLPDIEETERLFNIDLSEWKI